MAGGHDASLFIAAASGGASRQELVLRRANRHGLIAGATGTGKTVTLQVMAEQLSRAGVSSFMADVKGDLAGIAMPGSPTHKAHDSLVRRAADIGVPDYRYEDNPVVFWDLFGEQGHPIRTTISEMGPLLLSRLLGLNDTQEGVMNIAFRVADEQGLLLLDLKDLRAMLAHCADNAREIAVRYGNVSTESVGVIQRQLLTLEAQGGDRFFGEPALRIEDLMRVDSEGRGQVNVLAADRLMASPRLYSTFLLWLMSELFETLPEVGDPDRPKLVFFFDEAHLLFNEAPKALIEKVEQVVRLIRSKGVGVYFITQNPIDVPDTVSGQLGNRVQHALRAFTPREQSAVRAAANSFRPNPAINVEREILELKVGEALVSLLMEDGAPSPVARALIRPPMSRLGPLSADERRAIMATSPVAGTYDTAVDRESAYEMLKEAAEARLADEERIRAENEMIRTHQRERTLERVRREQAARPRSDMERIATSVATGAVRAILVREGTRLLRGVLGGMAKPQRAAPTGRARAASGSRVSKAFPGPSSARR